jgi:pantoate--beta-alanine ligase
LANEAYFNADAYSHDNMIILKKKAGWIDIKDKIKAQGTNIAFVPTMGALHEGHISLLVKSKELATLTVSSIFVNPTQFNNANDFKKYPVTTENDILILERNKCDVLFLPSVKEIYPEDVIREEQIDLGYLETILEGEFRPGHFQGVCQVVKRLLEVIRPDYLLVGQKDYQQCMVIKKLLEILHSKIQLVICPTVREEDGLAMSSRNLRLTVEERELAPEIFKTLSVIKNELSTKNIERLKQDAKQYLEQKNFKVDYVEIADARDLHAIAEWNGKDPVVILAAAFVNDIRLIDNIVVEGSLGV